jgi:hypothetical protein
MLFQVKLGRRNNTGVKNICFSQHQNLNLVPLDNVLYYAQTSNHSLLTNSWFTFTVKIP